MRGIVGAQERSAGLAQAQEPRHRDATGGNLASRARGRVALLGGPDILMGSQFMNSYGEALAYVALKRSGDRFWVESGKGKYPAG